MTSEEFQAMIAGLDERRHINIRQVSNGFTMGASRSFHQPGTGTEQFNIAIEGVAPDTATLLARLDNFFTNGDLAGS